MQWGWENGNALHTNVYEKEKLWEKRGEKATNTKQTKMEKNTERRSHTA